MSIYKKRRDAESVEPVDVLTVVQQFRNGISRKEWLDPNKILSNTNCQGKDVQSRQESGKLLQFFGFEAGPDQEERQEKCVSSKSDQLNQGVLNRHDREQNGPQDQYADPQT